MIQEKFYNVVLFKSRKKDNLNVPGFKTRSKTFLIEDQSIENFKKMLNAFYDFASRGVKGELSRFYISVNKRDHNKVRKALAVKLINEDNINIAKINSIICSIAAKPENAAEHKWLFDLDTTNESTIDSFEKDLKESLGEDNKYTASGTPNGIHFIVGHGFDCRKLIDKYKDIVELKRDAMKLFLTYQNKSE